MWIACLLQGAIHFILQATASLFMATQQLFDYVKQQLAAGVSQESISSTLKTQGWGEQDIKDAFGYAKAPAPPPNHRQGHRVISVRLVVYALLGFLVGAAVAIYTPLHLQLSANLGPFGIILPALIIGCLGALFGNYVGSKVTHVYMTPGRVLLGHSLTFYGKHAALLIVVWAPTLLFAVVTTLVQALLVTDQSQMFLLLFVASIMGTFFALISTSATLWFLVQGESIHTSPWVVLSVGIKNIWSLLWVTLLGLVASAGAMLVSLFSLLLASTVIAIIVKVIEVTSGVEGIFPFLIILFVAVMPVSFFIFTVAALYASQSSFIYFAENKKGLSAVAQSWMYVKGKAGQILWRWLVLGLFALLLYLPLLALFITLSPGSLAKYSMYAAQIHSVSPTITGINLLFSLIKSVFIQPLVVIFGFYLFQAIRETYVPLATEAQKIEKKKKWLTGFAIVGTIGSILIVLMFVATIGFILNGLKGDSFGNTRSLNSNLQDTTSVSVATSSPYYLAHRSDGVTPYFNKDYNFSIQFPKDWAYIPASDIQVRSGFAAVTANSVALPLPVKVCKPLVVQGEIIQGTSTTYEPAEISVRWFATTTVPSWAQLKIEIEKRNHTTIIEDKDIDVNGRTAHMFEYTVPVANGPKELCNHEFSNIFVTAYLFKDKETLIEVDLHSPDIIWEDNKDSGISALNSFKFLK
jgi:hypothetical protein